ncbi:luciferin 4-monooxygenase-like isoform X2 [Aricia agestis]|nr:luciferin 4-monooxygenase-like isoform X2 [Aricia agestis]XP_041972409.1 luciferin 4-monooxygenase-like isoform X2 [Aricia agestis]
MATNRPSDAIHIYMTEVACRLVAKTGIPSDRYHLGKLILQGLKEDPEFLLQIDGGTGETETCGSVLARSVRLARVLQRRGFGIGDVIVIMAPNNIHVCVPMYAAFYLGVAVACVDLGLGVNEMRDLFTLLTPKAVFCLPDKGGEIQKALAAANVDSKIVTFGNTEKFISFEEMLNENGKKEPVDEFKAVDFDPDETLAMLISTSGSTGSAKSISASHKNLVIGLPYFWNLFQQFPTPTRLTLALSPLQWYSAIFQFVLSPVLRHTRLHTSSQTTPEHIFHLVNKYRPTFTMIAPSIVALLLSNADKCDVTCFDVIFSSGSAAYMKSFDDIKTISPKTQLVNLYGQSEVGAAFFFDPAVTTSFGKVASHLDYRLVDVDTLQDVTEPNTPGELWLRGPSVCKGYYKRPVETAETLVDGWLRTGDIMYRDHHDYFYYVDRHKMMLKYRNYQISPLELEGVIQRHPGVHEVGVSGVPDALCGDLPVAFVVPRPGVAVSADEIQDLVKEHLSDSKQLRGGVRFVQQLPLTATAKIDRQKLKSMAKELATRNL